jgi:hypothetical protein
MSIEIFHSSKSYQVQTSHHETKRYPPIASVDSLSNIIGTSDSVKSKTKNSSSTKKISKNAPTPTKRIQKRPVKSVPAKGLESDSESEDLLDHEVDEENALAELEQQQGHIQGTNEDDQVPLLKTSPTRPLTFPIHSHHLPRMHMPRMSNADDRDFSKASNPIPPPPQPT